MFDNITKWFNKNTNKLILLLLIFLVIWQIVTKKVYTDIPLGWINKPHPSGKFGNSSPGKRIYDVIKELGKPDIIDKTKGGVAIWKKNTLKSRGFCWERVEIHDEQIPHLYPAPHTDFLYTWYKINIPKDKLSQVLEISDSISYDNLKKVVSVRCHTMGANKATLLTIKRFVNNEIQFKQAKKDYKLYILATFPSTKYYNKDAENSYTEELCEFEQKK